MDDMAGSEKEVWNLESGEGDCWTVGDENKVVGMNCDMRSFF